MFRRDSVVGDSFRQRLGLAERPAASRRKINRPSSAPDVFSYRRVGFLFQFHRISPAAQQHIFAAVEALLNCFRIIRSAVRDDIDLKAELTLQVFRAPIGIGACKEHEHSDIRLLFSDHMEPARRKLPLRLRRLQPRSEIELKRRDLVLERNRIDLNRHRYFGEKTKYAVFHLPFKRIFLDREDGVEYARKAFLA